VRPYTNIVKKEGDEKMTSDNTAQRIVMGLVIMMALLAFFGCAKKGQMAPGPDEVEVVGAEEAVGEPVPYGEGDMGEGVTEESLRAQARQELQDRMEDISFDFDKYNIRSDARLILQRNYEVLQGAPGAEVFVEGHCDERGTVEYNLALGQRRANAARDYLISLGMGAGEVSTVSYGEERPLDPRQTEEAWAKNRRCHFVILKK
jgi:peptidoglycan-associated lipoprotein